MSQRQYLTSLHASFKACKARRDVLDYKMSQLIQRQQAVKSNPFYNVLVRDIIQNDGECTLLENQINEIEYPSPKRPSLFPDLEREMESARQMNWEREMETGSKVYKVASRPRRSSAEGVGEWQHSIYKDPGTKLAFKQKKVIPKTNVSHSGQRKSAFMSTSELRKKQQNDALRRQIAKNKAIAKAKLARRPKKKPNYKIVTVYKKKPTSSNRFIDPETGEPLFFSKHEICDVCNMPYAYCGCV